MTGKRSGGGRTEVVHKMDHKRILANAHRVFALEEEALKAVDGQLGNEFIELVERSNAALDRGGKLVLTGIGKSGYIGKKIAATLSSIGSTAVFLHPVEALHGDFGMVRKADLMIALSYSGETDELLTMIAHAKRLGVELVSICGKADCRLGRLSDLVVPMLVEREACPFNLAPTSTTTALLALGDAWAMVMLQERGFTKEDYGRFHPGGAIGRMVTLHVKDIMRSGDRFAVVAPETLVRDALCRMGHARCGSAIVTDPEGRLLGIFTDGDFRRAAEKDIQVLSRPMQDVMTPNPVAVNGNALAVEVVRVVEERKISDVIVVDDDRRVLGLIDVQDLPGLKLM